MFVFFHVGPDLEWPARLVQSILAHNPGAGIIQVTDADTPAVDGVTRAVPTDGDRQFLMQWRVEAFAQLNLDVPALYLDTDMLVRRPIDPARLLGDADIAMTRRSFARTNWFIPQQRGLDYAEHAGKRLDQVYPYIGCGTITPDAGAWRDLAEMYQALPDRYRAWYGDQEVLREYACGRNIAELPEHHYACLPEHFGLYPDPAILHFKGKRKKLIANFLG